MLVSFILKTNSSLFDLNIFKISDDKSFEVIVQEVDGESKKIVLMLDLGDVEMDIPKKTKKQEATSTSDKLEIPQDVIDSISDSLSEKDTEK